MKPTDWMILEHIAYRPFGFRDEWVMLTREQAGQALGLNEKTIDRRVAVLVDASRASGAAARWFTSVTLSQVIKCCPILKVVLLDGSTHYLP